MTIYRFAAIALLAALLLVGTTAWGGDFPGRELDTVAETTSKTASQSKSYIQNRVGNLLAYEDARVKLKHGDDLRDFYASRNNRPVWLSSESAFSLILDVFRDAPSHGLNAADYHMVKIVKRIKDGSPKMLAELEILLSDAFLLYAHDLRVGRYEPKSVDEDWLIEREAWNPMEALQAWADGKDPVKLLDSLQPPYQEYAALRKKLRVFRVLAKRGGWPQLNGEKVLEAGDNDPEIAVLRQRLQWEQNIPKSSLRPQEVDQELVDALTSARNSEDGKPTDERLIAVVKKWQSENELKVDGVIGPQTGAALESAVKSPDTQFSAELASALKKYQKQHGMEPDGVLGADTRSMLNITAEQRVRQIMLNMERYRWLPRDLGDEFVWVDVAAYRMKIEKNGETAIEMPVIVGKAGRETPAFSDTMIYMEFNPYWNVPVSIAMRDLVPKQAEDPGYFAYKHIRVFEDWSDGARELKPSEVDWKSYVGADWSSFKYRLRQDPGPKNSLGQVKFIFPNDYSIYLHDTPHDELFEETVRSFSSGCIRVERPVALAKYLLEDVEYTPLQTPVVAAEPSSKEERKNHFGDAFTGQPEAETHQALTAIPDTTEFSEWSREAIKARFANKVNERIDLKKPLPVYIVYLTAWVDGDGNMQFRDDVYDRDKGLQKAIERDGPKVTGG